MSGMTMIEKILAAHSGKASVKPGDVVVTKFDHLSILEINFGMPSGFYNQPKKIHDANQNVIVFDHLVPAPTVKDADSGQRARAYRDRFGVKKFFDVGNAGINHYLLPEVGLALPGMLVGCSDSHTASLGAYNCGARGLGTGTLKYAICKGDTWFKICPTILVKFVGKLPKNVSGRDVFFKMAMDIGMKTNFNFEFAGPGLKELTIYDRQAIATQCVELGAEFATFPCDEVTRAFFKAHGITKLNPVASDPDASYAQTYTINLAEVVPMVALPPKIANNCKPARELKGLQIHQAYIGSCAGSSIEDIKRAADVLRGKHIHKNVRMIIAPGSQRMLMQAVKRGYVADLLAAGAVFMAPGCGACFGQHSGLIADGERAITTTTRNPKGRMGSKKGEVYLASATTVALAALNGTVVDPRDAA